MNLFQNNLLYMKTKRTVGKIADRSFILNQRLFRALLKVRIDSFPILNSRDDVERDNLVPHCAKVCV